MAVKLRLKNATLKQQYTKVEQSLQQKEDMGEVLHVIDFDQLKIENQQYLEKIEDRNNELLRLKLTTGNTVQVARARARKPRGAKSARKPRGRAKRAARAGAPPSPRIHPCSRLWRAWLRRARRPPSRPLHSPSPPPPSASAGAEHAEAQAEQPDGRVGLAAARDEHAQGEPRQDLGGDYARRAGEGAGGAPRPQAAPRRKHRVEHAAGTLAQRHPCCLAASHILRQARAAHATFTAHAAFATQTRHLHHSRRSSQILDYVQQKAEQYELERSLNAWRRKVDIAEMEAKRYAAIARKGGIPT